MNSRSIRIRAALEIGLELAAILAYIWVLEPYAPHWACLGFLWGFCVGFPVWCILTEQRWFPEFSLDWHRFLGCLRGTLWFTVVATGVLIVLAFQFDGANNDEHFLERFVEYVFWAFLQQFGLQSFLTRRFEKVFHNPPRAAFATATVFALIHFPNPALMTLTWTGGFFWSLSFLHYPNLYALAISHGWLAVMSLLCVPVQWMHQLRIGPTYWTFIP